VLVMKQFWHPLLLALALWLVISGTEAQSTDYTIINTGIKAWGCWYDSTRLVVLKEHQVPNSQSSTVEGLFYLEVSSPNQLKQINLSPLAPEVMQRIYRINCKNKAVLFSVDNQVYSVRIGEQPELIAEKQSAKIYPEYVNDDARYVLSPRGKVSEGDLGVSPSEESARKDCRFSYVKAGFRTHCWYINLRGLPNLLPQFVFGEYYWSETIRVKGADGQERRVPNPEPPLRLPDGTELKHGYLLRDLENRVVQQVKMEQPPYQIYRIHLKVDPQGMYVYANCSKAGDHGDKHYTEGGRVCRFKLDGKNHEWEEVFAVQKSPKDPYGLQDLDVNAQGDVVVIDRGHSLNQSLWKYTASSRKVEFVTRAPLDLGAPLLSPDGRCVSFILRGERYFAHAKGARP
jgi:hypothetical protein